MLSLVNNLCNTWESHQKLHSNLIETSSVKYGTPSVSVIKTSNNSNPLLLCNGEILLWSQNTQDQAKPLFFFNCPGQWKKKKKRIYLTSQLVRFNTRSSKWGWCTNENSCEAITKNAWSSWYSPLGELQAINLPLLCR